MTRTRMQELAVLVRQAQDEPTVVYFAQRDDDTPGVKIGLTRQLAERMRALQCHPLVTVRGDSALERAFHVFFADARIDGEWFQETSEMREFLEACWSVGQLRWV